MIVVDNVPQPYAIAELYAWVLVTDEEAEGIAAAITSGGAMPLISSKLETMEKYEPVVAQITAATGKRAELRRFAYLETLKEVEQ